MEPGLAFALFDLGLDRTSASHGALLLATETLFTIVLAVVLLGERVGRPVFVALVLGIAGSVLVVYQQAHGEASIGGDVLVLASLAAGASVVASRASSAPATRSPPRRCNSSAPRGGCPGLPDRRI